MDKRLNRTDIYRKMAAYYGSLPAEVDHMVDELKIDVEAILKETNQKLANFGDMGGGGITYKYLSKHWKRFGVQN